MTLEYVDFAETPEPESETKESNTNTAAEDENVKQDPSVHNNGDKFPEKLHYMLGEIGRDGLNHIVSWQPHGRCFVVHRKKEFEEKLLPFWFRQTKVASFQRQLNIYGFRRITSGQDKNGYYHEFFLRGKQFLCRRIQRQKIKGNGPRKPSTPETEPNFYMMKALPKEKDVSSCLSLYPIDKPWKGRTIEAGMLQRRSSISPLISDAVWDDKQGYKLLHMNTENINSDLNITDVGNRRQQEQLQILVSNNATNPKVVDYAKMSTRLQQNWINTVIDRGLTIGLAETSSKAAPNAVPTPVARGSSWALHDTSRDVCDYMRNFQCFYDSNSRFK